MQKWCEENNTSRKRATTKQIAWFFAFSFVFVLFFKPHIFDGWSCIAAIAKPNPRLKLAAHQTEREAHHYTIEDLTLRDIQVEGRCMCPIRIVVQSKIQKIKIENLFVEMWDGSEDQCTLRNFDKNLQLLKG